MKLARVRCTVVTDASGDGLAYSAQVNGLIRMARYIKADSDPLDGGATVNIKTESGASIWDGVSMAASGVIFPLVPAHNVQGGDLKFDDGTAYCTPIPVCDERIKVTVASGGNVRWGTFEVLVEGVS